MRTLRFSFNLISRRVVALIADAQLYIIDGLRRLEGRLSESDQLRRALRQERAFDLERWIKNRLESRPYWKHGHYRLGLMALERGNVALAYGSAQALFRLELSSKEKNAAEFLMARCYLSRGAPDRAEALLGSLWNRDPANVAVAEQLAAAYMAQNKNADAVALLRQFNADRLSPSATAVLRALTAQERT